MYGDCTTYAPIDIVNKGFKTCDTASHADLCRWFIVNGYGKERAEHWIKEFLLLGLLEKNGAGWYRIAEEYAA